MTYRYTRWDGSQDPFGFDADDLMSAMSDELIDDGDIWRSLRRMMRWGDQGKLDNRMEGTQRLLEKLRQTRQQYLDRHDLSSLIDDIKQRLENIVEAERSGIERRLESASQQRPNQTGPQSGDQSGADATDQAGQQPSPSQQGSEPGQQSRSSRKQPQMGQQPGSMQSPSGPSRQAGDNRDQGSEGTEGGQAETGNGHQEPSLQQMLENIANRKLQFLDQLPDDVGGQIKELSDYEFMDDDARQQFQELMQMLQQQLLQQHFQGLQQSIQNMTPEDLSRVRNMVRDLNRMLRERMSGGEPNFEQFMQQYDDMFPDGIENLDQLVEHLQKQMAQMQSLLNSMTPEMREQLQGIMDSLLQDDRLRWDMAELAANLEQLYPMRGMDRQYPFQGDEPLTFAEAMAMMDQLQQMDELERQLRSVNDPRDLDQIDPEQVRNLLGEEAEQILEQLRQLTKLLEEAGYIQRRGDRWELTPKGIRAIGQKALQDIFAQLKRDRIGRHEMDRRGAGGDRSEDTKHYEFGDAFHLDLRGTLMNSVRRRGAGSPVALEPNDFEVYRTEFTTTALTVLMVDMSRSMWLRGCFAAAKKVALAMNSLIQGQFPRDNLYVLVFAHQAQQIKADELPQLSWDEYIYGTNMQHGFMLARQLLARHRGGNRQIIMITDGEPTAHLEDGQVYFSYPPTYRTIQETLKEVGRCTREGIIINTFMLETGHYLVDFVNQMTTINKGRAFYSTPDRLGEYILVDYVASKKKRIR